jgi:leucyl-tRNA synthetase
MGDKSFYLVFAYPTTSGALHVGHIRSYTLPDIIAKYHLSKGENIFFPLGFHATGSDAIKIYNTIKADPDKAESYGIPSDSVDKINEPEDVVKALASSYIDLFRKAGLSLNYDATISTIDPAYSKVIEWQFRKLYNLGYLIQKDYQLPWCPNENQPVHLDASESDITNFKGNKVIKYGLVLFGGDLPLLGYTTDLSGFLGPITLEINSKEKYAEVVMDGKKVVMSEKAIEKLRNLGRDIKKVRDVAISDINNLKISNPITHERVAIRENPFDVADGTDIKIIGDAETKGSKKYHNTPDSEEVYKKLEAINRIDAMQELSAKPVYCRCGAEVIVKTIKNQWFIDYSNKNWKESAKKLVDNISTFPSSYKGELYGIIDWLGPRPCVRRTGLGTKFPFEDGWIIEALSDSNIYMAIYIIAEAVNASKINADSISDKLLDYVFLGTGKVDEVSSATGISMDTIKALRERFENTYPLDVNFGGMEHKSVHFPFFIFNHAAIFPERYWPRAIFLNWHVISNGEKMSKHLGNYVSWNDALNTYGTDAVRLYIASGADQWSMFNWSNQVAEETKTKLSGFINQTRKLIKLSADLNSASDNETIFDKWLLSKLNSSIQSVTAHIDRYEIRPAILEVIFNMTGNISSYLSYNKINCNTLKTFIEKQVAMLYPFIPNTSMELLRDLGVDKAKIKWPSIEKDKINKKLENIFNSLDNTIKDLKNIKKIKDKYQVNENNICYLYVSTDEEKNLYNEAKKRLTKSIGIEEIIVYKVGDRDIYDPENRASRAKPFRPAISITDLK